MNNTKFKGFIPLRESSNVTNILGQKTLVARKATKKIVLQNTLTNECFTTTDLAILKYRRKKKFDLFISEYMPLLKAKSISICSIVFDKNRHLKISDFISFIKKKCRRKKIVVYAYCWIVDVGEEQFKTHVHFTLITSRLCKVQINNIKSKCDDGGGYSLVLANNFKKSIGYLKKKEVFSEKKQHSYGFSNKFKKPN